MGRRDVMKAVVYYDVKDFRLEEIPVPQISSAEILVRVKACGICSTDIFKAKYGKAKPGAVLGHEISGEVAEVGPEVTDFKVGDRVGVLHHAPCGACYFCLRGQEPLCDQYRRGGVIPGGFSEYIRVLPELARKTVLKIPDTLTYEEATMTEPTACSVRALIQCEISPGDRLLVIGDGPMGLLLAILAKYFGASQVIMSGHHDFRVRTAEKLGVDYAYNSQRVNMGDRVKYLTDGRGADIVIVAVASTSVVQEALKMAQEGGKICLFGDFRDVPQPPVQVAPDLMISQNKALFGSWGCSPRDYQTALNMIKMGRVPARELITQTFPMERFPEALDLMEKKGECLRVVLQL